MSIFYAVDPGKKKCAVAAFLNGELVGAYLTHADDMSMKISQLGSVAMEMPRAYPHSPVRVNDLIDLTAAGMAVAAKLTATGSALQLIYPADWKGQVPKKICQRRIEKLLIHLGELARMKESLADVIPSLRHNLWDAVGIGLFSLKRCRRGII